MNMTMSDKHRARVKKTRESRWEARLGRKRSSEKMSFKFLVKLRR
jgi:hypothetical protein